MEATGGTFQETVLDIVANDTRGVVLAHHQFDRNGRRHAYNTAHVYRIDAGRLTSFEEYPEDLYAFDAAWSERFNGRPRHILRLRSHRDRSSCRAAGSSMRYDAVAPQAAEVLERRPLMPVHRHGMPDNSF